MLPEGKKALSCRKDDVCYYEYMKGDGFATRMVIGKTVIPPPRWSRMIGSVITGDFDLVPILETFIKEHPGFSIRAQEPLSHLPAITEFLDTGQMNLIRTQSQLRGGPQTGGRRRPVPERPRLGTGFPQLGPPQLGYDQHGAFQRWTRTNGKRMESLIGPTDIILYLWQRYGTWKPYTDDNERFTYLKSLGFRYFCNVDASTPYWMQLGRSFRQGRRNLMATACITTDSLSDLFNVRTYSIRPDRHRYHRCKLYHSLQTQKSCDGIRKIRFTFFISLN